MNKNNLLFWNVDTQYDFVMPDGKLYVSGAELLRPLWKEITTFAAEKSIRVVNSADYHNEKTVEISNQPDFIHTFPPHCMQNTVGAEFVAETLPANPLVIDWNKEYNIAELMRKPNLNRNIVIRKDKFDVFAGNPYTDEVVSILNPETVVVYGVTTNVCVDQAVQGLAKRVKNVIVLSDAIKELANIPLPYDTWEKLGVTMLDFDALKKENKILIISMIL